MDALDQPDEVRRGHRQQIAENISSSVVRLHATRGGVEMLLHGEDRMGGVAAPMNQHEEESLQHADTLLQEAMAKLEQVRLLIMGAGPRDWHVSDTPY